MEKKYNKFWLECGKHWFAFIICVAILGMLGMIFIGISINGSSPTLANKVVTDGGLTLMVIDFILGIIVQTYYRRFKTISKNK